MRWLIVLLLSLPLQAANSDALTGITTNDLIKHIKVLASDEFEGRAPGTVGEERTLDYLLKQFKTVGLKPGNPDGSYFQNVPLVGITGQPEASLTAGGKPLEIFLPRDCVIWSKRVAPEIKVENTDVVFVGYGVVAPEYQWDDFKDVDVRGKTVLMLVNDPP